jgi:hypothetical protein
MSPDTFVDTDKDSEDTLEEMFEKIPDYKFHQYTSRRKIYKADMFWT